MPSLNKKTAALAIVLSLVAQRIERQPSKLRVIGSNPIEATITKKWIEFTVTAYSHWCTMPIGGEVPPQRGADNRWPVANLTIAADRSIPFGTTILLSYRGIISPRVVGDRGRAIKGNRIDLFMESCAQAKRFGIRKIWGLVLD